MDIKIFITIAAIILAVPVFGTASILLGDDDKLFLSYAVTFLMIATEYNLLKYLLLLVGVEGDITSTLNTVMMCISTFFILFGGYFLKEMIVAKFKKHKI